MTARARSKACAHDERHAATFEQRCQQVSAGVSHQLPNLRWLAAANSAPTWLAEERLATVYMQGLPRHKTTRIGQQKKRCIRDFLNMPAAPHRDAIG
jgi:hypothetical protein